MVGSQQLRIPFPQKMNSMVMHINILIATNMPGAYYPENAEQPIYYNELR